MTRDFFESGMIFPPQINPATGRFEASADEVKLKEMIENIPGRQQWNKMPEKNTKETIKTNTFINCLKIDSRKMEDIQSQIKTLADSYVPEWDFDVTNPDMGAVLASVYASQMENNIEGYNGLLEQYRGELMKLSQVSHKPACPAQTTILLQASPLLEEEQVISAGSRFFTKAEEHKLVFETATPVSLTPARLKTVFMTSSKSGKMLPIKGEFKRNGNHEIERICEEKKEAIGFPFSLFKIPSRIANRQAILLYHSYVFDVNEETVVCKICGSEQILKGIEEGKYKFLYYTEEGFCPVESCRVVGEHVLLEKKLPNKPVMENGVFYSVWVLEAKEFGQEPLVLDSIAFSSVGNPKNPDYIGNGILDFESEEFKLFGEQLVPNAECYIGMDHYFSRKDAKISLKFHGSFQEKYFGEIRKEEPFRLKLIKRKPKKDKEIQPLYVCADEIVIEYYNGLGWKRLECEQEYKYLFDKAQEKDFEVSFTCPEDWEKVTVGAYNGRSLRIRLLQAQHVEKQPCIHQVPVISEFTISYSYEENYRIPQIGKVCFGSCMEDITRKLQSNESIPVFGKGNYDDTSLYLGFDRKMLQGPISLWWDIEGNGRFKNDPLKVYYSSSCGFKELKVTDGTEGLTRSGIMEFLPPLDMEEMELEGERGYFIRITKEDGQEFQHTINIHQIVPNAVKVYNVETLETREFYLDDKKQEVSFLLGNDGILDAQVWVNERNEFSLETMEKMVNDMPDRIKLDRNYLGEITEFFVKWEEVPDFFNSNKEDRHYILDRKQGKILFKNKSQGKAPKYKNGVAFTVQLRCCKGKKGNIEAKSIWEADNSAWKISNISNPKPAFGGCDMDSEEKVLQRATSRFSSGNRLITELDYKREVLHFSDTIDKVAVISGIRKDGSYEEGSLQIVPLMKDFKTGKDSFYQMKDELKRFLLQHSEMSVGESELQIEEPVFVKINVEAWVQVKNSDEVLKIETQVKDVLEQYLDAASNEKSKGWDIGTVPEKNQLLMRLNSLKNRASIKHIMVTASYEDYTGFHESDIDEITKSPYMVVMNGEHRIHISTVGEKKE